MSIEEYVESYLAKKEIYNSQLKRFRSKYDERFKEIVEKCISKYKSKEYEDKYWNKEKSVPVNLLNFLFDYVALYGRECNDKEIQLISNRFTTGLYYYKGYYFIKSQGQGETIIDIFSEFDSLLNITERQYEKV